MSIKAKRGIREVSGAVGEGSQLTDRKYGYALVKEQLSDLGTSSNIGSYAIFNKDRSVKIRAYGNYPSGNYLIISRLNPTDISQDTELSRILLSIGQSYMSNVDISSIATISPNDDFVLIASRADSNIYRVAINPIDYAFLQAVGFDTGINNPKKLEILDDNNYVNYDGQNVQIFNFDGEQLSIAKTIALDFDIVRINCVNGFIAAIGANVLKIINPSDDSIIYEEDFEDELKDIICDDKYAFIKTLSSVENPVFCYKVSESAIVSKISLTVEGAFLQGNVTSLVNIVKDDNAKDDQYVMIYQSSYVLNMALSINLSAQTVRNIEVGADVLVGDPLNFKPVFLSGNRIIYSSGGNNGYGPSYKYMNVYIYIYIEIEHRVNGKLFKIVGLGE